MIASKKKIVILTEGKVIVLYQNSMKAKAQTLKNKIIVNNMNRRVEAFLN